MVNILSARSSDFDSVHIVKKEKKTRNAAYEYLDGNNQDSSIENTQETLSIIAWGKHCLTQHCD